MAINIDIGANGNWWLDGADSGTPATGNTGAWEIFYIVGISGDLRVSISNMLLL